MKSKTAGKLKKEAWKHFSIYIRTRDALKTTNTLTHAICITCDTNYPIKNLHAGHFIPGRHNSILFDERGVHAQCGICNLWRKGNTVKYFRKMQQMYGDKVIEELEQLDTQTRQYKRPELLDMIYSYKIKLAKLGS